MRWAIRHTLPWHDAEVWRSCDGGGLSLEEDKFKLFQQRFGELVLSGWTLRYCKAKWYQTVR